MENAVREVLLKLGFDEEELFLEVTERGNIGGYILSDRFDNQSQVERQEWLWSKLDSQLSGQTRQRVIAILTMTPEEVDDDVRVAACG